MRMNAGLILQGSSPDIIGSLDRGAQAGRRQALSDLYREQGEGIAAGDQNALSRLAQLDPNAAVQIQSQQQYMAAQKQRMQVLDAQQQQVIMQRAAQASAAELAAEKEAIQQGLMRATMHYQNGNLDAVNAILQQAGEQPIQSLEQFPAVAGMYEGVLEVLERVNEFGQGPEEPAAIRTLRIRAEEAGLRPGTPEYQEFMASSGSQVTVENNLAPAESTRPIVAAPDKGWQRRWDEEAQSYVDEPVPNGAVDREMQANARQAKLAQSNYDRKQAIVDKNLDDARQIIRENGRWAAGRGSILAPLPESSARLLEGKIRTVLANLGFEELQAMRDSSPTGGALGSITEREIAFLQAIQARLDTGLKPNELIEVIDELQRGRAEFAKERAAIMNGDNAESQNATGTRLKYNPETGDFE